MKISSLPILLLSFLFLSENNFAQSGPGVRVSAKVFLQGALIGVPDSTSLMRDDLRSKKLLPVSEPYTGMPRYSHQNAGGAETIVGEEVFEVEGENAIVDWVYLELRSADVPSEVLATRSALLQRDGDVVDMDGVSPVFFGGENSSLYHVAVRHRNHLGIMTDEAFLLDEQAVSIDFSDPSFPTYGDFAQVQLGEKMAMWAGDFSQDGVVKLQGPNNDNFHLFSKVLSDAENTALNTNHIAQGYFIEDVDLDGEISYSGVGSDRSKLFVEVFGKGLQLFGPDAVSNGLFTENLPW